MTFTAPASCQYRVSLTLKHALLYEQVGTPLCVPTKGGIMLGRIASMEINHKAVEKAKKGDNIALKIEATSADESSKLYGRHFDFKVTSPTILRAH